MVMIRSITIHHCDSKENNNHKYFIVTLFTKYAFNSFVIHHTYCVNSYIVLIYTMVVSIILITHFSYKNAFYFKNVFISNVFD